MTCKDVDAVALVKGELDEGERLAAETHIADCEACRAEFEKTKSVLAMFSSAPRLTAAPDFADRVTAALVDKHPELAEPEMTFGEFVKSLFTRSRRAVPAWATSFAIHLIAFGLLAIFFWNVRPKSDDDVVMVTVPRTPSLPHVEPVKKDIRTHRDDGIGVKTPGGTEDEPGWPHKPDDRERPGDAGIVKKTPRPEYIPDHEEIRKTYHSEILRDDPVAAHFRDSRRDAGRTRLQNQYDKDHSVERAVQAALKWLSERQEPNGAFTTGAMKDFEVGVSALCVLTFLADGHTHKAPGKYRETVRKGVEYLLSRQDPKGRIGVRNEDNYMYNHAIATIALLECLVMTDDKPLLEDSVKRAVAFIVAAQNQKGGWGYTYGSPITDTSVTVWQLQALRLAASAGLKSMVVPALIKAKTALALLTDAEGKVGYRELGQFPHGHAALTAMGMAGHMLASYRPDRELIEKQAALVQKASRLSTNRYENDLTFFYYGSFAMFQLGNGHWTEWVRTFRGKLLKRQNADGSFPLDLDKWAGHGGQLYTTSMATLILQTFLRYPRFS